MGKIKSIYQDKKTKKWYFRAYLGMGSNGKRIQKTRRGFSTQREAKIAYDNYMSAYGPKNSRIIKKELRKDLVTFEEFYKSRFVKWYERQVKRQTFENAQFIFEKKLISFYHYRIIDITTEVVEDWIFELSQMTSRNSRLKSEKEALSKSYINRIRGHLKIVMDRAEKEGYIDKNPVINVSILSVENKKVSFWEFDDFIKVINSFKDNSFQNKHRKLVFELLFYTGLRIGELSALSWSNVNLKKNQITVERTLVYTKKDNWYFSTPKTKSAYRTISIGKRLSRKLEDWKKEQSLLGIFEFVIQLDGTFTPPYSFAHWLKEAAIKSQVQPIKLHSLRHSHVAFLIEQNVQPLAIMERLGHSNIQITLGTYGHLYAKSDSRIIDAIDTHQV
ncbi:site-specific integrase [Enterococcus casseliflavus]|uniref:site-specific integrase n=2 Tax=Enterococcus TaxID=1350 RepID=UPI001A963196|nr:site-specific integrase [Enterococcus casseliflavus]MBO1142583.1 site-specific integrase [Enterococcus casseliflavus]